MKTLVIGGTRSGKSRHALELAADAIRPAFLATAEAFDEEMRARIRRHRQDRSPRFATFEAPVDLAGALARLPADTDLAVVDCLTVWLGNLLHYRQSKASGEESDDLAAFPEVTAFLAAVEDSPRSLVLVSNEVGLGVIGADALTRSFVDLAGRLNQAVAERCQRVVLVVAGQPLMVKGGP